VAWQWRGNGASGISASGLRPSAARRRRDRFWFNDLSDGPPHGSTNLPWVVAGSAGGALKTGQYLKGNYTINKIHNSIGAALGVTNAAGQPLDDFGDADYREGSGGRDDGLAAEWPESRRNQAAEYSGEAERHGVLV